MELLKLLKFDPAAPGRVRLIAWLILAGTILETFAGFAMGFSSAEGLVDYYHAIASPLLGLSFGVAFAAALGRLTTWVYWLAVMLWAPLLLLLMVVVVVGAMFQESAPPPATNIEKLSFVGIGCFVMAAGLLMTPGCRKAFRERPPRAMGPVSGAGG